MNASARNMEAVYKAKLQHDATCPWKGIGKRIFLTAFDIERMGWEDGDIIAGMVVLSDSSQTTGRFRVECDEDPEAEATTIEIEAISKEVVT